MVAWTQWTALHNLVLWYYQTIRSNENQNKFYYKHVLSFDRTLNRCKLSGQWLVVNIPLTNIYVKWKMGQKKARLKHDRSKFKHNVEFQYITMHRRNGTYDLSKHGYSVLFWFCWIFSFPDCADILLYILIFDGKCSSSVT